MSRLNRLLRPMTLLDILDGAFDLYKTNLAVLVGIVAVIYLPIQAMETASRLLLAGAPEWVPAVINLVYFMFLMVASFLVMGPSMWAISEAYLGHKISVAAAYRRMLPRFFPFAATYLLWILALGIPYLFGALIVGVGIGVMVSMATQGDSAVMIAIMIAAVLLGVAAMLAGLLLYIALVFTCPSFVAEDRRYFSALKRSWQLVKGYYWRTLGIALLAIAIVGLVQTAVSIGLLAATGMLTQFVANPQAATTGTPYMIYQIGSMLASIVLEPVWLIVVILLYYDLRIRKEGFDLAALAVEMGYREPEPAVPVSAYVDADAGATSAEPQPPPE